MIKSLSNKCDFIIDLMPYTSFGLIRNISSIYMNYFKYSKNDINKGNSHDSDKKIEYMNYSNMSNVITNTNTDITEGNMIELIQAENGYYWIANNTDTQDNFVYDITNQEQDDTTYFSKRYTKAIIKNTNWCDYCLDYYFMHRVSIEKFIAKCSDRFNKNHMRFFQGKEAHMLGTILTIDKTAKGYLRGINMGLHNYYGSVNYKNDAQDFTIGGIIEQYNIRAFASYGSGNTNICHNHNTDYNDWLMKNNISCSECERMACPFHYDNMGFNIHNICGICVDGNVCSTNSKSITNTVTNTDAKPKMNENSVIDLDLFENCDLYD